MDVAYATDESYPDDQCFDQNLIPQDVGRKGYYRISQRQRSPSSVSQLLQPLQPTIVVLASRDGTSYRKTIMTQPQTRNSYHIDLYVGQQGSRAGMPGLAPSLQIVISLLRKETEDYYLNAEICLHSRRTINLSTFKVRTLQSIKQISELISIAVTYHIDVINVQEHRFYHEDTDLKYHELGNGWPFISASDLKNTGNSTIVGVGMVLSPYATKSLNSIEKITPQILVATFHGNPEPTLISSCSPTSIVDEQEVRDFYDHLSSLNRSVPKHNVLIIGGDLNAQIGQSMLHKFTRHHTSNRNGEY